MYYAGIGKRALPYSIINRMVEFGKELANQGYILRSGGASGADLAFETGCKQAKGQMEIYLPWKGFNHNKSTLIGGQSFEAIQSVAKYHPAPMALSDPVKKLMARNYNQIYGLNGVPSLLCICYTTNGDLTGGTSQALRIILNEVPDCVIVNLGFENTKDIKPKDFKNLFHCLNCERKLVSLGDHVGCTQCGFMTSSNLETKRILEADLYARQQYTLGARNSE